MLGDPDRLAVALDALIENAVAHTDANDRIEVSAHLEDGRVVLAVADSGCGIPAADLRRIFDRFARADSHRSREAGGFGLGLAVIRPPKWQPLGIRSDGNSQSDRRPFREGSYAVELPVAASVAVCAAQRRFECLDVVPTSHNKNLQPLVEGPAVRLVGRHSKVRRGGYQTRTRER